MTYDNWKCTNPEDEFLGDPPPPCERVYPAHRIYEHPRYPSGRCVECGAEAHQDCKWFKLIAGSTAKDTADEILDR